MILKGDPAILVPPCLGRFVLVMLQHFLEAVAAPQPIVEDVGEPFRALLHTHQLQCAQAKL